MKRTIRYQGAIIHDNHILLIKHSEHAGRSYWVIPGGGREDDDETEEACVQREMREETQLNVAVERLLLDETGIPDGVYQRLKTYLCKVISGDAQPGYEPELEAAQRYAITEVRWFDLKDSSQWEAQLTSDPITFPLLQRIQATLGYAMETIKIRPYQAVDLSQIEALSARVHPYRPEDEVELPAMFERAGQAKNSNDIRWMGFPTYPERTIEEEYDAFWVAEIEQEKTNSIIGTIAIQTFRADEAIPSRHPLVEKWQKYGDVAELRYLRLAPEWHGQGLGTRLCQTVIKWASSKYKMLIVNTTTPQKPALQLYRKLGFQEVGVSYIDKYELVWLELNLKEQ